MGCESLGKKEIAKYICKAAKAEGILSLYRNYSLMHNPQFITSIFLVVVFGRLPHSDNFCNVAT